MEPVHVLHFYYTRASTIKECLRRQKRYHWRDIFRFDKQPNLGAFVKNLSFFRKLQFRSLVQVQESMHLLLVFYSLLFVVIEGYQQLSHRDATIDNLLKSDNVDLLRRFRNGVFHFQEEFESEKILKFLEQPETEVWTRMVFKEFGRFFLERAEYFFAQNNY